MPRTKGSKNKNTQMKDALEVLADKLTPQDIEQMLASLKGRKAEAPSGKVDMEGEVAAPKRRGRKPKTVTEVEGTTIKVTPDYNVQRVRNLLNSVDKHVTAILVTVHKIQDAGAVPEEVYDIIDSKLDAIKISAYRQNAADTSYEPRTSKGGRPKKVVEEKEAA